MSKFQDNSKNRVNSLAKGLRVLEAFTAKDPELLLSEVGRRAGLDNATSFRMLNTLLELGYVDHDSESRRFRLNLKCLNIGFNAIARSDLRALAQPVLRGFVADGAEAASLGVLDRGEVTYIERMQAGLNRTAVDIRVGMRINAHSSALGHALLAFLPAPQIQQHLDAVIRTKQTPHTLTGLKEIKARLKQVRDEGFALVDQESVLGLRAIAAPVFGADGLPVAAISIASANVTVPPKTFTRQFAKKLTDAAADLSLSLRASGTAIVR